MHIHFKRCTVPLAVLLLAACPGGSGPSLDGADAGKPPTFTYHRDVKPILDAHCVKCHQSGGIGPMPLTRYREAAPWGGGIRDAVESRRMPPWPPAQDCGPTYAGDRSLAHAQIDTIATWVEEGMPEGDPNAPGPALPDPDAASTLRRTDLTLTTPVAYAPTQFPDEYRCFLVPWPLSEKKYVSGFRINPGDLSVTHHVTTTLAGPAEVWEYQLADAADPNPGWSCMGTAGGTAHGSLGGWAPGMRGVALPEGVGIEVQPGSAVIFQMHYHADAGATHEPATVSMDLQLESQVQHSAWYIPFADPAWAMPFGMHIAPGDPAAVHRYAIDPTFATGGKAFLIYTATLHMHELGTKTSLSIEKNGEERCLLRIDDWDFHWQGEYRFEEPQRLEPGEKLKLECHWDNSAQNQPEVDGVKRAPKDVYWGWGTGSEMCLATVLITTP